MLLVSLGISKVEFIILIQLLVILCLEITLFLWRCVFKSENKIYSHSIETPVFLSISQRSYLPNQRS